MIDIPVGFEGADDWTVAPADVTDLTVTEQTGAAVREQIVQQGWARVSVPPFLNASKTLLAVITEVGNPIPVFRQFKYWRPIGVRLDKDPSRSEGTGAGPFHMDFVNAERPPRLVCLYCDRVDPAGGGASHLSDVSLSVAQISYEARSRLTQRVFRDGVVHQLDNIGGDANPFAVIANDQEWPYRYTGSLLQSAAASEIEALTQLEQTLRRNSISFTLQPREAVIFDNGRMVHARGELGPGQADIDPRERRLLYEGFSATFASLTKD